MSSIQKTGSLAFVFILTLAVFSPSLHYPFVNWDDPLFITQNESIRKLDAPHLLRLFRTLEGACYAPLSRLSAAMDLAVWGFNPFGFHLTQIVLHSLSACWVCLIANFCFQKTSLSLNWNWIFSIAAALLFSLHPLRVESVVWISERRDVLALFFGLASVYALLRFTDQKKFWLWVLSLILFTAALLSKASVATLPLVLLVLDIYLLKRCQLGGNRAFRNCLLEKLPFLALGIGTGWIATHFQVIAGAAPAISSGSWFSKAALSSTSLTRYLAKIFGVIFPLNPLELAHTQYSFQQTQTLWASLGLVGITLLFIFLRKRFPLLLAAWFCYLILILPFTGWVHVGGLLTADRYTYLAAVPLTLVTAGGFHWLHDNLEFKHSRKFWIILPFLVALGFTVRTVQQIRIWQSSEILWHHSLSLDGNNPFAWRKLGDAQLAIKKDAEALTSFKQAVKLDPGNVDGWFDLAFALGRLDQTDAAASLYQQILNRFPKPAKAHFNLGEIELKRGRVEDALSHYGKAAELEPSPDTYFNMGVCLEALKRPAEAIEAYQQAQKRGSPDAAMRLKVIQPNMNQ